MDNQVQVQVQVQKNDLQKSESNSFTNANIWKEGIKLVKEMYALTKRLPKVEQYGLSSQLRRASTSILANFAEGYSRSSSADKTHKYIISRGECSEVKALLLICAELELVSMSDIKIAIDLTERIGQMLSGLIRSFSYNS